MMIIAAALALAIGVQDGTYDQRSAMDREIDLRAAQETGEAPPGTPLQEAPVEEIDGGGSIVPSPSKHAVKDMARRLERVGEVYELLGRCVGSMTPAEVETTLRDAQAQPSAAYLLARFESGFRKPKDDEWCFGRMSRIDVGRLAR